MKSGKYTENSIKFYIIGLMFVLVGLILLNIKFSILDYSLIGIGVVLLILRIDETIKSI
jgi:EamA domain-containing membrane protein RarD